jgi:hypothetical protein
MIDWDEIARKKNEERERLRQDSERKETHLRTFKILLLKYASEVFDLVQRQIEVKNTTIPLPGEQIRINRTPLQLSCIKVTAPIGTIELKFAEVAELTTTTTLDVKVSGVSLHKGERVTEESEYLIWSSPDGHVFARQTAGKNQQEQTSEQIADQILKTFAWFIA